MPDQVLLTKDMIKAGKTVHPHDVLLNKNIHDAGKTVVHHEFHSTRVCAILGGHRSMMKLRSKRTPHSGRTSICELAGAQTL